MQPLRLLCLLRSCRRAGPIPADCRACVVRSQGLSCYNASLQLPIYHPSEEEKKDAKLYAANVRALLLREGGMKASESTLADCRAYISMLQGKPPNPKSQAYKVLHPEANGVKSEDQHSEAKHALPAVKKEK